MLHLNPEFHNDFRHTHTHTQMHTHQKQSPEVFYKEAVLKNFRNIHRETPV